MSQTESAYLGTIERMEPAIAPIDHAGGIASIAVSLKRIADAGDLARLTAPSRRDYFAAQVLAGFVALCKEGWPGRNDFLEMASRSYQIADAMLVVRASS